MLARVQYLLGGIAIGALLASYGYIGFAKAQTPSVTIQEGIFNGKPSSERKYIPPVEDLQASMDSVPFQVKCYKHDFIPFVVTDKDGKTLFEIRCP